MRLAFRLDATVAMGSGHLMRCLALADEMRIRGAESVFIMDCEIGALYALVQQRGHGCWLLPTASASDWRVDAAQTLASLADLGGVGWLVLDHYGLDARWESQVRPGTQRVMVIDDLADRTHDCDLLLDQNLHLGMDRRYEMLVPAGCRQLLGPAYALLRPEFQVARRHLRPRDGSVKRLAIFFGGTDPAGETLKALAAISEVQAGDMWPDMAIDVIVGSANPLRGEVEQACADIDGVDFHCQISNMSEMMQMADLCLGAGGTALWERAVLGVPSMVVTIADNQVSSTTAMAQAGALLYLGQSSEVDVVALRHALMFAVANPWLLHSLSARSLEQVDGQGLARVAGALLPA